MKVLFLSNNLKRAGKEKQIFLLTKGLEKYGIDFKIVLRFNTIDYPVPNERIIILKKNKGLGLIIRLRNIFKAYGPDIIHAWEGAFSLAGCISAIGLNIPFINGSIRYSRKFPVYSKTFLIQQILSKLSTVTVANSLSGLEGFTFVRNKKHRVIENGIDIAKDITYYHEKTINFAGHFNIGMVASFSEAKDYETLIKTGMILLAEGYNIQLTLVGDGPTQKNCMQLVPAKYNIFINLPGQLKDPLNSIKYFSVGVLLSHKDHAEGMSNSIMEYMAMKKPVIATNSGGNPELIVDGDNGFLIDLEDSKTLKEKLVFLMKNPEFAAKMGQKGFERIKENHNVSIYTQNWLDLYNEIAK